MTDQLELFEELAAAPITEPRIGRITSRIWSENKARLIERYLFYFVLVTKHGTYIDGFAGPQDPEHEDKWSAKLVVESRPRWLRRFFLFEKDAAQVQRIEAMLAAQPAREKKEPKRDVVVHPGDCNAGIRHLLDSGEVNRKQAAFALLDQRTFECEWATLAALASYKTESRKVELFYFLPIGWLDRALAATKDEALLERWWGRSDWHTLRKMRNPDRANLVTDRIRSEFGYRSVKPWPIFERNAGGRVMYYMVHATDHAVAPQLMSRAYRRAVSPIVATEEQIALEWTELTRLLEGIRR